MAVYMKDRCKPIRFFRSLLWANRVEKLRSARGGYKKLQINYFVSCVYLLHAISVGKCNNTYAYKTRSVYDWHGQISSFFELKLVHGTYRIRIDRVRSELRFYPIVEQAQPI